MPLTEQIIQEYPQLKAENEVLRAQVVWLKQQLFGGGQSEKLERAQLVLGLGEPAAAPMPAPLQQVTYERAAPSARVLPADNFAHLPVSATIELIPEEVKADPAAYERIGEERSFEIDVVAPQLVKREIIRPKYRHKTDRSRPPVVAPAPARAVTPRRDCSRG
jgi:hypothetical protein